MPTSGALPRFQSGLRGPIALKNSQMTVKKHQTYIIFCDIVRTSHLVRFVTNSIINTLYQEVQYTVQCYTVQRNRSLYRAEAQPHPTNDPTEVRAEAPYRDPQ